jgi:hypothetical protein
VQTRVLKTLTPTVDDMVASSATCAFMTACGASVGRFAPPRVHSLSRCTFTSPMVHGVHSVIPKRARLGPAPAISMDNSPKTIPVPSGVLLLVSSVLAIASVGCVFELSGGHPQYGTAVTGGILVVALPGFLYLFAAAIRKGQEEAELD